MSTASDKADIIRVLLVEDSESAAETVREMLGESRTARFAVERADRLSAGFDLLDRESFDVVLLDLGLPDSSGLETFLKLQYHAVAVPVVVITSLEDEQAAIETMRSGAQDYLIKGKVDAEILGRSLRYAIEHKRAERRLVWDHERVKMELAESRREVEWLRAELDRRRAGEQQPRDDNFESLSLLAAGIAHDFNNLVTSIALSFDYALMQVRPEERLYEVLHEGSIAARQAAALTRQLMNFAKIGDPIIRSTSLAEVLEETAVFALRGSKARCDFQIEAGLWPAAIDKNQICQVVQIMVINAHQAMPDGGAVTIEARNQTLSQNPHGLPPGDYVKVTVIDNGVGIPAEALPKIFDPYFTTKPQGTGLGLATAHAIIARHGGHIGVESSPGAGTSFFIYLPVSGRDAAAGGASDEGLSPGHGRVLLMDDDELVLHAAEQALKSAGYRVDCARDGREAIALYRAALGSDDPYRAVIMDLTVSGGMGADKAIRELLVIDPLVKAVVSSGYAGDPIMANYLEHGFKAALAKPYQARELHRLLSRLLHEDNG